MAEEGKRRRLRPSNWWEVQDDDTGNGEVEGGSQITAQSNSQTLNTNSNTPNRGNTKRKAKPWVPAGMGAPIEKRRGRPSSNLGSVAEKQKGRNDDGRGYSEAEAEDEGLRKQQPSRDEIKPRRGRKDANGTRGIMSVNTDTDVIETVTATSSLAPQKKRGRPPMRVVNRGVGDEKSSNAAAGNRNKGESKAKRQDMEVRERRRGRPALGNMGTTNSQKKKNEDRIEPENDESSRSQRRHQAEPESSAPGHTMTKASKDNGESSEKHAKPKKHVKISDVSQDIESESALSKTKKSLPSEASTSTRKRKDSNSDDQQPPQQTKRRRVEDSQDDGADAEQPEPLSYRHLAAVTRRVSLETINTKWEALRPGCLDKISELLIDVQRPVVLQIHDERKKTQASTAIQMISRRLLSRIRKGMPFPKGTRTNREDDFDFEKILDYNRALESQLTPVLHSNDLLEAELRKEEILLENEERYLAELEANAKAETISRRQAARKAHPLLQFEVNSTAKVLNDNMGIDGDATTASITLDTSKYQDLEGIFKNINGHVDSIKGNLQQVEGITEAMAKSKASVQAALFAHLDLEQYNDVVLG
ncbi:9687b910-f781-4429-b1e9-36b750e5a230 [Sclerotinia trifoliorum]|uniref:9687b910-f781-4429-b1e9-36b750e5a230 n=1 Tax=Sclerotinia trifoliorum TaxID=28548 RepID=A0A8H2ZLP2_9HELO|nr:9687b910-f781-4429-b1e9-36b750e5a230 [Sclerotinia trifoliorum]